MRSPQGPDTSAPAPAGFDGLLPWLAGTAGESQRETGALASGERGRVMSFPSPTSPASPGTKPLKPILKSPYCPAPSPSQRTDSITLLSTVGGFLFQDGNRGNPSTGRSRVTWNNLDDVTCNNLGDGHLHGDMKTSQGVAFKTTVVLLSKLRECSS